MRYPLAAIIILGLSACDHAADDQAAVTTQAKADSGMVATNLGNDISAVATQARDNIKETGEKLHKWVIEPPPHAGAPKPVASSYCYHVLQDILCYRQPMPGWEYRLVGYQGTGAEPPPPAVMQPLPVARVESAARPVDRVASLQPVFVNPPPEIKDTPKAPDATPVSATPDPAHEQLPDPAMAPQL